MEERQKLTYAQKCIMEKAIEKSERRVDDDFQDLHWDDVYSVYYDSK